MSEIKKFLDQEGVQHLWSKINMQDYPNNETLMAVISAIDETKVDKNELIGTNELTWDGVALDNIQVEWYMHLVSYDIPEGFLYVQNGKGAWNNNSDSMITLNPFKGENYIGLTPSDNLDSTSGIWALAILKANTTVFGVTYEIPGFYLNADPEYGEYVSPLYYEWNLLDQKANKEDLVQSDWNENDETSLAYIQNRTHYENILKEWVCFDDESIQNQSLNYTIDYYVPLGTAVAVYFNGQFLGEQTLYNSGGTGSCWMMHPDLALFFNDNILTISNYYETGNIKIIVKDLNIGIKKLDEKFIPDTMATKEYTQALFEKLNTNTKLGFYCIEEVTVIVNDLPRVFPANSNVEINFKDTDTFEIVTTSDNSILSLTAFPGALGTYYSWLEGVKQFSNILFDMNAEDFYSKWSQGNQGMYQVQYAQYLNCVFWSDNPYINEVTKRTNYTLYNSSQLPLCYSSIPDNTFKAFYLALGVNSDPNWSNPAYVESFAKATWATQVFSYYGARIVGLPEHSTITLPKDCRGLMFYARNTEAAGTFDATNVTNFGAKSGSWREAFGYCSSLRRLYISNLKVSLNVSWSPIDYESIYYIISEAANTSAITISVSPYTYNLLSQADFDLARSKNITIALITTNYVEDKRLSEITNKADISYVDEKIADLVDSAPETLDTLGELAAALQENDEVVEVLNNAITTKADKDYVDGLIAGVPTESDVVIVDCPNGTTISHTFEQIIAALNNHKAIYASIYDSILAPLTHIANDNSFVEFYAVNHTTDTNVGIDILRVNSDNTFNIRFISTSEYDAIILKSSTEGSSKKFRLTIGDDGVLVAEEVV